MTRKIAPPISGDEATGRPAAPPGRAARAARRSIRTSGFSIRATTTETMNTNITWPTVWPRIQTDRPGWPGSGRTVPRGACGRRAPLMSGDPSAAVGPGRSPWRRLRAPLPSPAMPPLTREQLARAPLAGAAGTSAPGIAGSPSAIILPLLGVAVLAVVIGLFIGNSRARRRATAAGPVAPPGDRGGAPASGAGDVVIARADGRRPAPADRPARRSRPWPSAPSTSPARVALTPNGGGITYNSRAARRPPRARHRRPSTSGAPAGTPVYSPVDGTVASVAPYMVAGPPARATRSRSPPATRPTCVV